MKQNPTTVDLMTSRSQWQYFDSLYHLVQSTPRRSPFKGMTSRLSNEQTALPQELFGEAIITKGAWLQRTAYFGFESDPQTASTILARACCNEDILPAKLPLTSRLQTRFAFVTWLSEQSMLCVAYARKQVSTSPVRERAMANNNYIRASSSLHG